MIEWRSLEWLPTYEVSADGQLRRTATKDGRPARPIAGTRHGPYVRYSIQIEGRRKNIGAHRLVCEAWHGPRPSPDHFVAHWDGDPLNNSFSNLRWATAKENDADKDRHGTRPIGERHGRAKLSWGDVTAIRGRYRGSRGQQRRLAEEFGVAPSTLRQVLSGKCWDDLKRVSAMSAAWDAMASAALTHNDTAFNEAKTRFWRLKERG